MTAALGFAFDWFGAYALGQWVHTSVAFDPSTQRPYSENSADLGLVGGEMRVIARGDEVTWWVSGGAAYGGGVASIDGPALEWPVRYEITVRAAVLLGFGAEVVLWDRLAVGPTLRWYAIGAQESCRAEQTASGREAHCDVGRSGATPDMIALSLSISILPSRTP